MDELYTLVYNLIHRGKLNIDELAEILGVSSNYVYKMGLNEDSPSHSDIGLRKFIALMKAQGDDRIVRYMCQRFGGVFVKLPRVAKDKSESAEMVAYYQECVTNTIKLMIDYFKAPCPNARAVLINMLDDVTAKTVGIRKRVQNDGQFNLFTE
ncbi:MAG: hypothetical protein M0R00_06200 [Candidatus Omnitrophica bacterium]|jgi:hypothetical protein|nr:hypothetical protein [Candidatus Omnitrophota bacterium]